MFKNKFILVSAIFVLIVSGYISFRYAWHYGTVAYFNYKCEKDGGEFIYSTVENVEGLFQIRLREPGDYFDRLSNHDIPEDPYGHTNWEAQLPHTLFVDPPRANYKYFETSKSPNKDRRFPKAKISGGVIVTGEEYWRYFYPEENPGQNISVEQTDTLKSQYGFTWREVRDAWDKLFGVWGGELLIKELTTDEILGIKRGYFYRGYFSHLLNVCPKKGYEPSFKFIKKILKPIDDGFRGGE